MPRKQTNPTNLPASADAGAGKPKPVRARTIRTKAEVVTADSGNGDSQSISNLAGAVAAGGGTEAGPDPAEVARLAYTYWQARGGAIGSPEADWYRAEQELRGRHGAPANA